MPFLFPRIHRHRHGLAIVASGVLIVGCASNNPPLEAPPETRAPAETPGAPPTPAASESETDPTADSLSIVIDAGVDEEETRRTTLLEAAQAERERRRSEPPPAIVITNENLAQHATGELTLVGRRGAGEPDPEASSPEGGQAALPSNEAYWRARVLEARTEWRDAVEDVAHLQDRVAELRQRFYAEDDPYYRDSEIKPAWDLALDRLQESRDLVEVRRVRVQKTLEEGREAGALPGWLREGLDLEPETPGYRETPEAKEHQPEEPTIVDDDAMETP